MPRRPRQAFGGMLFHVLNRAAGRSRVFSKRADYLAFEEVIDQVHRRLPTRILGHVLMPNHFHLALWPKAVVINAVMAGRRRSPKLPSTEGQWAFVFTTGESSADVRVISRLNALECNGAFYIFDDHMELDDLLQPFLARE